MPNPPKLFTPGPVDCFDEVLAALGRPVPYMSTDAWLQVYQETVQMLKQVMQTENDVFVIPSPGSGAIETGIGSLFQAGDKVLVVRNGMFAERLVQVLTHFRCELVSVEGPWGEAIDLDKARDALQANPHIDGIAVVGNETGTGVRNPLQELAEMAHEREIPIFADLISGMGGYDIPTDEWGLDIVATSSNKAFEMAPGLGILAVNQRAWSLIEAKEATAHRGWYYNLSTWKAARQRPMFPFPSTPPTTSISGLHASLTRITQVETIQGHWDRYAWAQRVLRAGLRNIGFEMLVCDADASFTVTTVRKRPEMENMEELRTYLLEKHNTLMAGGGGPLTGQIARIGHMGKASTQENLFPFLLAIEEFLRREKGLSVPAGAVLVGLEAEEKWY